MALLAFRRIWNQNTNSSNHMVYLKYVGLLLEDEFFLQQPILYSAPAVQMMTGAAFLIYMLLLRPFLPLW